MKEFEKHQDKKPESQYEANKQKEYKHVHSFIPKTGCKLFRWDKEKEVMEEVKLNKQVSAMFTGNTNKAVRTNYHETTSAHYNPNDLYFQAINKKSAMKKYKRYLTGETHLAETFEPQVFRKLERFKIVKKK